MSPRVSTFALLLGTILVTPAVAADDAARVSGSWTVDGQRLELGHARVFREADPFGKGTNPCVLASNEAVPDAAVPDDDEGIAELLDLMRSGTLRALQVCFDASGTKLRSVNDVFVFHPGISPGRFGFQGFHRFAATPAAGRIAGKLSGAGETNAGGTWSDEVEISVAMPAE